MQDFISWFSAKDSGERAQRLKAKAPVMPLETFFVQKYLLFE